MWLSKPDSAFASQIATEVDEEKLINFLQLVMNPSQAMQAAAGLSPKPHTNV